GPLRGRARARRHDAGHRRRVFGRRPRRHQEDARLDAPGGGGAGGRPARPVVGRQATGIPPAAFEFFLERVRASSLHGTPMASHQHIMFELAEMQMEIMASRLLAHRAAWMADHGMDNVAEASMAKAHGARTAQSVTSRAMVLLGEEALEPGHPVEKWYRDAKIYDIFEG